MADTLTTAQGERAPSKPAITRHPAFPAVVALWFAALLGLGSMVVPVTLLEAIVAATGLSAIVPGAEAPLGLTARGLIALAAASGGALAGLVLARKLTRSPQDRPARIGGKPASVTSRHGGPDPIRAHEELGGDGLNPPGLRRRALSLMPGHGSGEFAVPAPLPGEADPVGSLAEASPDSTFAEPALDEPVLDTLDADGLAAIACEPPAAAAPAFESPDFGDSVGDADTLDLAALPELPVQAPQADAAPAPWQRAGTASAAAPFGNSRAVDVLQSPTPADRAGPFTPAEDGPDLHELSLMHLAQRLALSLQSRRAMQAAMASPAQAAEAAPAPPREVPAAVADAAQPEEAAKAMAAYFRKPVAAAESPVFDRRPSETGGDHDRDQGGDRFGEAAVPTFNLDWAAFRATASDDQPGGDSAHADDWDAGDSGKDGAYGSLLTLAPDPVDRDATNPGSALARPFDPPGHAPAAPRVKAAGVDDALRSALAKLQRLSGAA